MKTILKNCRLLGTSHDKTMLHDVFVKDGVIEKIGLNLEEEGAKVLNVGGHMVMPGLIDMHCNICDPGHEYIEDIATVSRAALRGGFTTITCEPNTTPAIDNKTVVEYIVSKSKEKSLVNIYPYGSMSIGCEGEEMSAIGEMYNAGIVGISDGDEFTDSAAFLRNVMVYSKMFDLPITTHCEDRGLSAKGVMNEGYTAACLGLPGMPREA
ncbi:MAG: amidohydrolase family protein, partial [Anaerotignum sp.]|nr:amidohydrolase family protein [Anaerotignum sp.]